MKNLLNYVGLLACVVVLLACVCRIELMSSTRNRWSWFVVYVLFAAYALGTALQTWRARSFDWNDAAGIGAILVFVCITRCLWVNGPPPETVRGEP